MRTGIRRIAMAVALFSLQAADQGHARPPSQLDIRHRSLLELRNDKLVRQQWDISCGAAAVATLLTYQLGDPTTEREAALGMLRATDIRLVRARLGFSLLDLKRFAATRGFTAAGYANLSLKDLLVMAPIIVPVRVHNFPHFVIVRGERGDRLLVADPAFGNRTMATQQFARAWSGGIGFVVTRPDEPHPANRMGTPADLFLQPSPATLRATDSDLRGMAGS